VQPTPPGWYLDPYGRPQLWRWFTGRVWTEWVSADPRVPPPTPQPVLAPDDAGRVHAGGLSVPALGDPWRAAPPYLDLEDEIGQELVVAASGRGPYVACVFLGRLPDRFGYAGPDDLEVAGTALADDLIRLYYPHGHPHERVVVTEPLDGRPSWRTEVALDIEDEHLDFEREDALIALVDRGDGTAGVLYASLPVREPVPAPAEVLGLVRAD
jgi:hypothetical protein